MGQVQLGRDPTCEVDEGAKIRPNWDEARTCEVAEDSGVGSNWDEARTSEVAEGSGVRVDQREVLTSEVAEEGEWLNHPFWVLLRQIGYKEW